MGQSIVITDILDFCKAFNGIDGSEDEQDKVWEDLLCVMSSYQLGHKLPISFEYSPEDGALILFAARGKIVCMGVFDYQSAREANAVVFYPGLFALLNPIDYWNDIDKYVDYNLVIRSRYETLYFINKYDVNGGAAVSRILIDGLYESPYYDEYEYMRTRVIWDYSSSIASRLGEKALKYESFNSWGVWGDNIMLSALRLLISNRCALCNREIENHDDYDSDFVTYILQEDTSQNEPRDRAEALRNVLARYAIVCPSCYDKLDRWRYSKETMSHLKWRLFIEAKNYISQYDHILNRKPIDVDLAQPYVVPPESIDAINPPVWEYPVEPIIDPVTPQSRSKPTSQEVNHGSYSRPTSGVRHSETHGPEGWEEESILKENGYSVANSTKMTVYQRWGKLRGVIIKGLMTPEQIVSHIQFQIKLREGRPEYDLAIRKWKLDIQYVKDNYITGDR